MKKESSDFQTGSLFGAGKVSTHKRYFAHAELDHLVCWVMAESLDAAEDKESARLAVEQIIEDFKQKPAFSKLKIREYLNNAHQRLRDESTNIMLKAGLVMVISDYSKMMWAVSGNLRLYHFREKAFCFRSKDQTIAQLMVDSGNLAEEAVNSREERNNIINYAGGSTEFKPLISESFRLQDGDVLLLCNAKFWEQLSQEEIAAVVKEARNPEELVAKLQQTREAKSAKEAQSTVMASVFINRVVAERTTSIHQLGKQFLPKPPRIFTQPPEQGAEKTAVPNSPFSQLSPQLIRKAAMVITPLIMATLIGWMINQHLAAVKIQKELERKQQIEQMHRQNADRSEKNGDQWVGASKYGPAVKEYQKALQDLAVVQEKAKIARVQKKIAIVKQIIAADHYVVNGNYEEALVMYQNSAQEGIAVGYDLTRLQENITRTKNVIAMFKLIREGDDGFAKKDFILAGDKYQLALSIAAQISWENLKVELNTKIENVKKGIAELEKEKEAARLEAEKEKQKKLKEQKEKTTSKSKLTRQPKDKSGAKSSSKEEPKENRAEKGLRLEVAGDERFNAKQYRESIELYRQAKSAYEERGLQMDAVEVEEKLKTAKRKRMQSLFIR